MVGDEVTDLTLGVGVREGLLNLNRNLKRWVFRPFRFGTQSGDRNESQLDIYLCHGLGLLYITKERG